MVKSKFLLLLRTFSTEDLKAFEKYLKVQHKQKEMFIKIFNHIKKYAPHYDHEKLAKTYIHEKVLKKTKYSVRSVGDAPSGLYKILEEFLLRQKIQENSYTKDKMLLDIFKERKIDKLFYEKIKESKKKITEAKTLDAWSYFNVMELNYELYYHTNTDKINIERPALNEAMEQLNIFYLAMKLKFLCELHSRANILGHTGVEEQLDLPLDLTFPKEIPVYCEIYYRYLQLVQHKNIETFEHLYKILPDNLGKFEKNEQITFLLYLINFLGQRIKEGDSTLLEKTLKLHQLGLENEVFIVNHIIHVPIFTNIVDIASKLKKFDWTRDFIKKWTAYLPAEHKEDALVITQSILDFEEGEYNAIVTRLSTKTFKSEFDELRAKSLWLLSLVELKSDIELIMNKIKAFKQYLRRNNTLNRATVKSHLKFLSILEKLLDVDVDKVLIKNKIHKAEYLVYKLWLCNKIE